jgi:hypothetical protein
VEDRTVSLRIEKRMQEREISGADNGKDADADTDISGNSGFIMNLTCLGWVNSELPIRYYLMKTNENFILFIRPDEGRVREAYRVKEAAGYAR